jgi:hypothetical protein
MMLTSSTEPKTEGEEDHTIQEERGTPKERLKKEADLAHKVS